MRALLLSLTAIALTGCASPLRVDTPRHLFADALYAPVAKPPVGDDIFALSDEMREFAAMQIAAEIERHGLHAGLVEALTRELRLEYESESTRPAAQTFASRSGNCLSLVILAAAFARHADIPVTYQSVHGYDSWSRSQGIAFLSGHVNLKLGSRSADGPVIDFLVPGPARWTFTRFVDEDTVKAMYLNNRAAEALVAGDSGASYWWARAAVETAPWRTGAINTLGVVYLRHGRLREAERTLRYVLEREPANASALANLVRVLVRGGRSDEAAQMQARLTEIEPYPPFYFLDQGLAAMSRGENEAARALLGKELRRMPYYDEVHFALAVADLRLGHMRQARNHLGLALKYSTTRDRRDIYGAKLSHLKALEAN